MNLRTRWRPGDRFLVRHKDSALLVVEKKAGVLSQSTESGRGENLLALLRELMGPKNRVYPVHRLDRVVSGLLVFARSGDVQQALIDQFAAHEVERRYLAVVRGRLKPDTGTLESYLVTDDPSLVVYSTRDPNHPHARRAVTHYRVLERLEPARVTLIEVELETGLRNQIRVAFADAGHPLLGERKYRGEGARQGAGRIFLHAASLGFVHPLTGKKLSFEAPLPADLTRWLEALRAGSPDRPPGEPNRPSPRARGGPRAAPQRRRKKR